MVSDGLATWVERPVDSDSPDRTLVVTDVSDPTSMSRVGTLELPALGYTYTERSAFDGKWWVTADDWVGLYGLTVVDLTVPDQPRKHTHLEFPGRAEAFEVSDDVLYAVHMKAPSDDWHDDPIYVLEARDLAGDLSVPVHDSLEIGPLDGEYGPYMHARMLDDDTLLLALSTGRESNLYVVDVSSPSELTLLGEVGLPSALSFELFVEGDSVLAVSHDLEVSSVDLSDLASPSVIATANMPWEDDQPFPVGLEAAGGELRSISGEAHLRYAFPAGGGPMSEIREELDRRPAGFAGAQLYGAHAYLAHSSGIDVYVREETGTWVLAHTVEGGLTTSLDRVGALLLAEAGENARVYSLDDPQRPQLLGEVSIPPPPDAPVSEPGRPLLSGETLAVFYPDRVLTWAVTADGVEESGQLVLVEEDDEPFWTSWSAQRVGERVFAQDLWQEQPLLELDLSDSSEPVLVAEHLRLVGDRWLASGEGFLVWTDDGPAFVGAPGGGGVPFSLLGEMEVSAFENLAASDGDVALMVGDAGFSVVGIACSE